MSPNQPMTVEDRGVTLRDFFIFQVKLVLDGSKDAVLFGLSIAAIVLDLIAGRGRRPRLFYSVMRGSKKFDRWLNLHSSLDRIDGGRMAPRDGRLIGEGEESEAGADALLAQFEELARGVGEPKKPGANPPVDPR